MTPYQHGIVSFRRRGLERRQDDVSLPAAFVLDAHMSVAAELVASFRPASTLQLRGGARQTSSAEVAATLEHAVEQQGVRTIVVCMQDTRPPESSPLREPFLADALWLADHLWLARLFRDKGVVVEAMWLDVEEGDLYLWDRDAKRFELVADSGIASFVERTRARARIEGAA